MSEYENVNVIVEKNLFVEKIKFLIGKVVILVQIKFHLQKQH